MGHRRGRKPGERDVDGIVLLDKPSGMTSQHAMQKIKRLYKATKAGHTGSLDKPASGMLPVCLGEATKIAGYLLNADKSYYVLAKLGVTTTTADATGEIIATLPIGDLDALDLARILRQFIGEIEQTPPMYSALKVNGERLYQLAYRGEKIERHRRAVTIRALDLLNFDRETFAIGVVCSKGTYIRTLVEDIGEQLGCGAHVKTLRRLSVGAFRKDEMVTMARLEAMVAGGQCATLLDALLVPFNRALAHLETVTLPDGAAERFCQGQAVRVQNAPAQGVVQVYGDTDMFIGIGAINDHGQVAPKRLINTKLTLK